MWKLIKRMWRRLLEAVGLRKKPKPGKGPPLDKLTNVEVTVMSGNVLLKWTNPTARKDGQAASGDEFETRIGMKASAAPDFTPTQVVPGTDPAQASFPNVAGGDYEFEVVLYDLVLDKPHQPIIAPFNVPLGDLEPITGVTVDVTGT
jgi:hypothetical protein